MRAVLRFVGLAVLVLMWIITLLALYGPHRLPSHMPSHFDSAGHANGWGSPSVLWLMPVIVTGVFALMSWVARHPGAFNYPVRTTPANRPKLESLTVTMIEWLKIELACMFTLFQAATIESARAGRSTLSPMVIRVAILVVWGTIGWYIFAVRRVARLPRR